MKMLVIYDSVFGNTEKIAQAIAGALSQQGEVGLFHINEARLDYLDGLELLIVGSPTRGFQATPAVAEFLKKLPAGSLKNIRTAAFDTRFNVHELKSGFMRLLVGTGGYAANRIAKLMMKAGGIPVIAPEGFFVVDEKGPLKDGEIERAVQWARKTNDGRKTDQ